MADVKEVIATGSQYIVGDGSASPPVVRGCQIYGFRLVSKQEGAFATFLDGGPNGTVLRRLSVPVGGGADESGDGINCAIAQTNVYVLLTLQDGTAVTKSYASILVDKPTSDWLRRNT